MDSYRIHFESNCIFTLTDLKTEVDVSESNNKNILAKLMKCREAAREVEIIWGGLKGSQ